MSRQRREEVVRIFRERAPRIGWCPECNVPVLRSERCSRCGSRTIEVKHVAYPRDVRLAFECDIEKIVEAIEKYAGVKRSSLDKLIRKDEIVLLNKVQHVDAADEVIVRGRVVGVRYFSIEKNEWEFRPAYHGARMIVEEKLGYYMVLKLGHVQEGEYIEKKYIVEGDYPEDERTYIPFKTAGGVYGVCQVRGNKIRIVKLFGRVSDTAVSYRPSTWREAYEANCAVLEFLEKSSLRVISDALRKYSGDLVMVTCSGGKDSTVVAYLSHIVGVKNFVYCDTGLELPETHETIDRLSKHVPVEIVEADRKLFENLLDVLGPPARDFRWCTTVCKLLPLKRYIKSVARGRKVVSITGQRMFESPQRALAGYETPVVGPNPADVIVSPLYDWTAFEVELYILSKGLPLNRLYELGFERVGCYICPTLRMAEIKIIQETHPELWDWWLSKLKKFRKRFKVPDAWIRYGIWRWRFALPGDFSNYLRSIGVGFDLAQLQNPVVNVISVTINRVNNEAKIDFVVTFIEKIDLEKVKDFIHVIPGEIKIENGIMKIFSKISIITIYESGRVSVWSRDLEICQTTAENVLKVIALTHVCIRCGECVQACVRGVLKLADHPVVVSPEECDKCKNCIRSCPISKYFGILFSKELESKLV